MRSVYLLHVSPWERRSAWTAKEASGIPRVQNKPRWGPGACPGTAERRTLGSSGWRKTVHTYIHVIFKNSSASAQVRQVLTLGTPLCAGADKPTPMTEYCVSAFDRSSKPVRPLNWKPTHTYIHTYIQTEHYKIHTYTYSLHVFI